MRRALFFLSALVAGIVGGAGAAFWAMEPSSVASSIRNGPWGTSDRFGAAEADALTRALVARVGLFALAREETIYYTAFTDSDGAPLNGACRYQVTGPVPDARWWSLTLYDADHYLFDGAEGRYSIDADDAGDLIDIAVGAQANADLPAPGGPFSLTLRLYNPAPPVYRNLAATPLPAIKKGAC